MIADQLLLQKATTNSTYKTDRVSEQPKRSVVKSLSWRVIGTLDTIVISWIITGALTLAFSIGMVELVTKMVLYFLHERMWNSIKCGR
ncbi:DUF2061 domain-containing protein [Eudoraea adriatica]|uniref:DUF2061 domain-containing protein n=1 Tax=Eudoraea adriatica TaxID=446681 RepID=UPI000373A826|nr:DUF2061 domain-containing protein [Eudoraea adriatica]